MANTETNNDETCLSDEECTSAFNFSRYLEYIITNNHYQHCDLASDFKNVRNIVIEQVISVLISSALDKFSFNNVFREIALEIYYVRPDDTLTYLNKYFSEKFEEFENSTEIPGMAFKNFNILIMMIPDFYNSGLLTDETIEHFLNVTIKKSPKMILEGFQFVLAVVLMKYQGQVNENYVKYFKDVGENFPEWKLTIPIIEEFIQNRIIKEEIQQ
jgi:hypothetical protein